MLHSVGVTVRDLDATMVQLGRILGIEQWEVVTVEVGQAIHHGRRTSGGSYRAATGTTVLREDLVGRVEGRSGFPYRAVTFELVQPLSGETAFKEFLATRGQGVSHVVVAEGAGGDAPAIRSHLDAAGVPVAAAFDAGGERRVLHDTRRTLGGFFLEVRSQAARTPGELIDISERIERPHGVSPLPVIGVSHFGVVIDDLMATMPEYHRLLGCEVFPVKNWRACHGSLDAPYYRGEQVEHGYFTGMGTCGDFQFEIIQPTYGPSDYNVDFRDAKGGPGIHHLLLYVTGSADQWQSDVAGMAALGHPQLMGSDLTGGGAEFCYFDTAEATGFVIEGVWGGKSSTPPDPALLEPWYVVDFTELIEKELA